MVQFYRKLNSFGVNLQNEIGRVSNKTIEYYSTMKSLMRKEAKPTTTKSYSKEVAIQPRDENGSFEPIPYRILNQIYVNISLGLEIKFINNIPLMKRASNGL